MLNIVLGSAVLAVTALGFWFALPVGGQVRPWITPRIEPMVSVAFVAAAALGVGLITVAIVEFLT